MFKALHVYVGLPTYILDNICCFSDIYADHICSLVGTYMLLANYIYAL